MLLWSRDELRAITESTQQWFQFRDAAARGYVPISSNDAMSPEFMCGSLVIAHGKPVKGGAVTYRLVLTGEQYGHVWRDDRARSTSVGPCTSAFRGLTEVLPRLDAYLVGR